MAKVLTIQLPLNELSDELMTQLDEMVKSNAEQHRERKCSLRFRLVDFDGGNVLEMPAKSLKINPSNQFLEKIKSLNGLSYKLN
jgi:DNA polymerase-3 subunit alpha